MKMFVDMGSNVCSVEGNVLCDFTPCKFSSFKSNTHSCIFMFYGKLNAVFFLVGTKKAYHISGFTSLWGYFFKKKFNKKLICCSFVKLL